MTHLVSQQNVLRNSIADWLDNRSQTEDVSQISLEELKAKLKSSPYYLEKIDPDTTPHYEELAIHAISLMSMSIIRIPSDRITKPMVMTFLEKQPSMLSLVTAYHPEAIDRFMDKHLYSKIIEENVHLLALKKNGFDPDIKDEMIDPKAMISGIMKTPYYAYVSFERGFPEVVKDLILTGFWPKSDWIHRKSDQLTTLVRYYLDLDEDGNHPYGAYIWYHQAIKLHPVEDVVRDFTRAGCAERLTELYERDEVAPYVRDNSRYKKQIFMEDIGV